MGSGLEAESLPAELAEDVSGATDAIGLGPTPASQVRFVMDTLGVASLVGDSGIRTFGWVEGVTPAPPRALAFFLLNLDRTASVTSSC